MKSYFLLITISLFFIFQLNAQKINLDSWAIGLGTTNTIMHGDLTSLKSESNEAINLGFYLYVNKMISPTFGFELKGQALKMRGSTQSFIPRFFSHPDGLYFEGNTFGGELNAVINLSGLGKNTYTKPNRKLSFSAYAGIGYHTYDSKLYDLKTDELITDFENVNNRDSNAKSIYYTAGLGLRYNLSHRLDIELRQSANFNNEDHLDAAIYDKQVFETFFTTNLGVVFKLSKKDSQNIIWQDSNINDNNEIVETIVQEEKVNLKDSDEDGVLDQFDKEPNTPKGALTYGNGVAIDTDKDGVIDFNDKCPLKKGLKELEGCPISKDSDSDGVNDIDDLCPYIVGPIDNRGCPISKNTITEVEKITILNLAKNIYFTSGKSYLRDSSKRELDKIGDIMIDNPNVNFIIEGHTDSGGKRVYNLQLSQDRANSVKNYLVNSGVSSDNLKAIGYGFSIPKYNNRTSDGRQLNRRVEIKVDDGSQIINNNLPTTKVYHLIKKEDTLFSISKKYNVSIKNLKEWNNLSNNEIILGQKLIVKQ